MTVTRRRGLSHQPVVDYRHQPHLAHWPLHDALSALVLETVRSLPGPAAPVLEVDASHGGFTELLLALAPAVTLVELWPPAHERIRARLGGHPRLTTVLDPAAGLEDAGGGYALALCVSVLHHVPDYVAFLGRVADRLRPGGVLLTVQDPLWYPRAGRATRAVDRGAYLLWRAGQGRVRQGAAAALRRLRGGLPEGGADGIVYHHVVRSGVDEEAVADALARRFTHVELVSYWSHHLAWTRRAVAPAGLVNTFAARARERGAG